MKNKIIKLIGIAILSPILLFLLCFLLFYFPPFQNWAVKQVTSYASSKTGMQIDIKHVNLEFPFNLGIEGVEAIRPNDSLPQLKDTVADIRKAVVDIELLPLLSKRVVINRLDFEKLDRKSTRLNSSHANISYAVFCLKKKKQTPNLYHSHRKKLNHASAMRVPGTPHGHAITNEHEWVEAREALGYVCRVRTALLKACH